MEQQKQEPQREHRGRSTDRQEVEQAGAALPSCLPRTLHRRAWQREGGESLYWVSSRKSLRRIELRFPLTVSRAAAGVGTAAARHVAAAGVRATLAPADPQKQQEEDAAQDHRAHKRPLCKTDTQVWTGQLPVWWLDTAGNITSRHASILPESWQTSVQNKLYKYVCIQHQHL